MTDALLSALTSDVFAEWLSDTLLATGLLLTLVLLIRRPVARQFGPEVAYLLWAVPLARLFMPPITRTIEVAVTPVSQPGTAIDVAHLVSDSSDAALAAAPAAAPVSALAPEPSGLTNWFDWTSLGLTIWLCGAAIFLVAQLAAYLQNRRELLEDARPVGRIGSIEVIEIAGIAGPFAFGLWKKYIALPIGFDRQYDPVERNLALAHESAHHRAGDLWANFAGLALLSLHWFNPIAWAAWRAFRFDQEAACDARVLRARGAAERRAYARAIAKAATGETLAFASPLNPKKKIVERLKMMNLKEQSRARKRLGNAMVATGLVSALALTATISYAVQPVEAPEPPAAPEAPMPPEAVPLPPSAPAAPEAPDAPDTPPAPSGDEQEFVYRFERDGKKMVVRRVGQLSQEEIDRIIADTEKLNDQAMARAGEAEAKVRQIRVVRREGGDQVIKLGDGREMELKFGDCEGADKKAVFMVQSEAKDGKTVRTNTIRCGDIMPDEAELRAHIERAMGEAKKGLEIARVEIRKSTALSESERAEAMREIDSEMAEMRRELEAARKEIEQLRRERDAARN